MLTSSSVLLEKASFHVVIRTVFKILVHRFQLLAPIGKTRCREKKISGKIYTQALAMYSLFACKDFGDYHHLYLRIDVFILADVFETFRNVCLKVYNLDPDHFFSAPNRSWDAKLITARVEIGLLTDIEIMLFSERAIRGGVNGIGALRHFKANNPDTNHYNANEPSVYGAFFEATSLYAGTMQQSLPLGAYTWKADSTIDDILNADPMGEFGYFGEVDLIFPKELHHSHNDLSRAPEKLTTQPEWLSPYAKSFNNPPSAVEKLMETLFDKRLYVCHFRDLHFYHQQGLKVEKLHRALQFKQSNWLGTYLSKNTVMRKQAINEFEKNFYKLTSNACFGKNMENLQNRRLIKFVQNETRANSLSFKPNFKSFNIHNANLVSVVMDNTKILWIKPTPVGAAILDLSKVTLYGFH